MRIRKLCVAAALCSSASAFAMPDFAGSYACKAENGVTSNITLDVRDNTLFTGGDLDIGSLAGGQNGLPCENKSDKQAANGVTMDYAMGCDAKVLFYRINLKQPPKTDFNMTLKFTKSSAKDLAIEVKMSGKMENSAIPAGSDVKISCVKK